MKYQKANINDIKEILVLKNIVKQRVIKENLPIWKNGYPEDIIIIDDINKGYGRIIKLDDKIVAFACFHPASDDYNKNMFKLDNLHSFSRVMVHDDYTNQHIGDFLVKNMIQEAKSLNVNGLAIGVDACNIKAVKLYKRNGFTKEGEFNFSYAYLDLYSLYFNE